MAALNNTKKIEDICVLICAHNEAEHIGEVVRTTLEQTGCKVVVVDDGSDDGTAALAEQAGAYVLRNPENLGKGASLRHGFDLVRERGCDAVVVVDGDGQHDPREIQRFLDAYARTGIPVLIGNRMADTRGMPFSRKWTNRFMCWVLNRLTKIYVADPPCGFRFYRADILPFIMSNEKRFAFEFDILIHAALRHIRVDSVRISTIYHHGHHQSQVAPLRDAWLLIRTVLDHFCDRRLIK
ncbi:MAG: glycosyltransferase family 2 protein [Kiritimatiellales bacterium]|nr:glycosyltransferase family 2 protein [Kiritimatiellales bacterium]